MKTTPLPTALSVVMVLAILGGLSAPDAMAQKSGGGKTNFMGLKQAIADGRTAAASSEEARRESKELWTRNTQIITGREGYLPELIVGGEWTTTITVTNFGTESADGLLGFLVDNNGDPLTAEINGEGNRITDDAFELSLGPGVVFEIEVTLPEGQAYGHIFLPPTPCGTADCVIYAQVALKNSNPTRPDFESVFPLSAAVPQQGILFDHRDGFYSTLYLVNAQTTATTVRLTMLDDFGRLIGSEDIAMTAEASLLVTLHALFPESLGNYGMLIVQDLGNPGDLDGIVATMLRINPTNSFTPLRGTEIVF